MKPLTLEETSLKEEMKERFLNYNEKAKFYMLCHLEDFELQYCELQQKDKELKKKYENAVADYENTMAEKNKLKRQLEENKNTYLFRLDSVVAAYKKQQQEFIKYMDKTIEELECEDVDDEEMKGYLIQRIDTFKEILQKYKELVGVSDEKKCI